MSATMSGWATRPLPRRWLWGVCADLAERAAVPVWVPRLVFALFGMMHLLLAGILYAALAWLLSPRRRPFCAPRFAMPPSPPFSPSAGPGFATVDQRFRKLDDRLSHLEAEVLHSEAELRQAFRDLERRR